jgi:hypothetical protein
VFQDVIHICICLVSFEIPLFRDINHHKLLKSKFSIVFLLQSPLFWWSFHLPRAFPQLPAARRGDDELLAAERAKGMGSGEACAWQVFSRSGKKGTNDLINQYSINNKSITNYLVNQYQSTSAQ